ncbi:hypothetical protein MJH12_18510 [bacterium]|nr:hypothetical protein [bacterium]
MAGVLFARETKIAHLIHQNQTFTKLINLFDHSNPFGAHFIVEKLQKKSLSQQIERINLEYPSFTFIFRKHQLKQDQIYINISNLHSKFLNSQQKQLALDIFNKALKSYKKVKKLGNIPLNTSRYLSSPCITFFLGENIQLKSFIETHFDFIASEFPKLQVKKISSHSINIEESLEAFPQQMDQMRIERLNEILQNAIFDQSTSKKDLSTPTFSPFEVDESSEIFTPISQAQFMSQTQSYSTTETSSLSNSDLLIFESSSKSIQKTSLQKIQTSQSWSTLTSQKAILKVTSFDSSQKFSNNLTDNLKILSEQLKDMSKQIESIDFTKLSSASPNDQSTHQMIIDTTIRPDWLW